MRRIAFYIVTNYIRNMLQMVQKKSSNLYVLIHFIGSSSQEVESEISSSLVASHNHCILLVLRLSLMPQTTNALLERAGQTTRPPRP